MTKPILTFSRESKGQHSLIYFFCTKLDYGAKRYSFFKLVMSLSHHAYNPFIRLKNCFFFHFSFTLFDLNVEHYLPYFSSLPN